MRRLATALALAALICCLCATSAGAYWTKAGAGTGSATTATMPAGLTPTVSVAGTTVTLTITQVQLAGTNLGAYTTGGYKILRYPAAGGTAVTPPAGTCSTRVSGAAATLSCTETGTPRGDWKYTVTPVLSTSWTGTESAASATVTLAPDVPTGLGLTLQPAAAIRLDWTAGAGATGYNVYRRTSAGTYNFATPVNGATPVSGTTYTDTTPVSGTAYTYVVRSVVIGSFGQQIESANSNEPAAVTADGTVPTGVTLNAVATPMRGTITLSGAATDTGSGLNNVAFQYKLSSGSTWVTACSDTTTPHSCTFDTTTIADGLYDFRALATDNAGNQTASASQTNRRIDNTAPTVTPTDPGRYVRGNVTLGGTAADAGSGIVSIVLEGRAVGSGTWVTVCTSTTSPLTCTYDTTTIADGAYEIQLTATDAAGNTTTSPIVTPINVDNTAPTAASIATTNGGTAGRPDTGDTAVYGFSEPIKPASILAGWTGTSTPVTVRLTQGATDTMTIWNAANTTQLSLGSVTIGTAWITASATFNATMVMSGNNVTVTLGTQTAGTVATSNATFAMVWSPSASATDLAGNPMSTATRTAAAVRLF